MTRLFLTNAVRGYCLTVALAIFLFTSSCLFGQDTLRTDSSTYVKPGRVAIVLAGSAAIITAAHVQNYNSWWKGERSTFHLNEDGRYNFLMDKYGHCYFTYLMSDLIGKSFHWSGINRSRAILYGSGLALAFQLYVEIEDGFTPNLGFSVGDAVADVVGAAYPVLQYHQPWLENVRMKFSVIPSERYKRGAYHTLIDDYESQYYWLSANIAELFPRVFKPFWPSFLCLTVGQGVKNLDGRGDGDREIFIGLDYDFTKLPGEGSFLSTVKHVMNFIHFPAPTIRVTPSLVAYGLRF